jgi:hypothetical protein
MGKGFLFFAFSCCILVLSIINLSIGPVVNKVVDKTKIGNDKVAWGTPNVARYKDLKNDMDDEDKKNRIQSVIDALERFKGMHDMEYTSFIFDIVIGFVCSLLGLFHLFDLKKEEFASKTGLIGFICGIVGFALSFVYVIFNGLVFTGRYSNVMERESDGYFAERIENTGNKYICITYHGKYDAFSGHAKFSDLNKKQYNYEKNFYGDDFDRRCICEDLLSECTDDNPFDLTRITTSSGCHTRVTSASCQYIYADEIKVNENKDIFDRFLTTLILSSVVCLANIGLALFGFLLFRTPGNIQINSEIITFRHKTSSQPPLKN